MHFLSELAEEYSVIADRNNIDQFWLVQFFELMVEIKKLLLFIFVFEVLLKLLDLINDQQKFIFPIVLHSF